MEYVDLLGEDYSEWMTSPEQVELFKKLVATQELTKKPLKECYVEVVEALNIAAQIKGKPKRAYIQGNPRLN